MSHRVLLIDDDTESMRSMRLALEAENHVLKEMDSAEHLDEALEEFHPNVVICDTLISGPDGLSVCKSIRSNPEFRSIQVVLVSAKDFERDKRAALDAGAAAYVVKPFEPDVLRQAIRSTLVENAVLRICGVRGSVPTPERAVGKYGGNTSCVEITLPGNSHLVFDAGTGICDLGRRLVKQSPMRIAICLTHYHWDHIQGLPFFAPLYVAGNEVLIHGPAEDNEALADKIKGEMGGDYFPVSIDAFAASVDFVALHQQTFATMGMPISAFSTLHPGRTLAYRAFLGKSSIVYAPDNELLPESVNPEVTGEAARLARFAQGATLLLHDCTYSDEQYQKKRGWGHSCSSALAAVAVKANVEKVILFHHDPDNDDDAMETILAEFNAAVDRLGGSVPAELAVEGTTYVL